MHLNHVYYYNKEFLNSLKYSVGYPTEIILAKKIGIEIIKFYKSLLQT